MKKRPLKIKTSVIAEIRRMEDQFPHIEFGGWLIKEGDTISEIVYDMKHQSYAEVELDVTDLMDMSDDKIEKVVGWFHKHPINGWSGTDIATIETLSNFFGRCYSIVLQTNGKLLYWETVSGCDIHNTEEKGVCLVDEREIDIRDFIL